MASGLQFHLILQDAPGVRLRWSDLEADARFEWEAFCYQLAHELCPYWLRVQRVNASLRVPSGRRETIGLVVEDFQQAARSRGSIIRKRPEGSVDLADVLALEVFLAVVGDRDWAFDYDDRGRWRQHNVVTFFDGGHLCPVPFDFQFTVPSTPRHELYRDLGVSGEAQAFGSRLARLFSVAHVDPSWAFDTITVTRCFAEARLASPRLAERYAFYLDRLESALGESHAC